MFETASDAFRKKTPTRRSFLRGLGLLAATVGTGVATSRSLFAQEGADKKDADKPDADKNDADKKDEKSPSAPSGEAPPETKLDALGTPYRDCPECGSRMYQEADKTWLCEECGYTTAE